MNVQNIFCVSVKELREKKILRCRPLSLVDSTHPCLDLMAHQGWGWGRENHLIFHLRHNLAYTFQKLDGGRGGNGPPCILVKGRRKSLPRRSQWDTDEKGNSQWEDRQIWKYQNIPGIESRNTNFWASWLETESFVKNWTIENGWTGLEWPWFLFLFSKVDQQRVEDVNNHRINEVQRQLIGIKAKYTGNKQLCSRVLGSKVLLTFAIFPQLNKCSTSAYDLASLWNTVVALWCAFPTSYWAVIFPHSKKWLQ